MQVAVTVVVVGGSEAGNTSQVKQEATHQARLVVIPLPFSHFTHTHTQIKPVAFIMLLSRLLKNINIEKKAAEMTQDWRRPPVH